jgi:hypothetical protein
MRGKRKLGLELVCLRNKAAALNSGADDDSKLKLAGAARRRVGESAMLGVGSDSGSGSDIDLGIATGNDIRSGADRGIGYWNATNLDIPIGLCLGIGIGIGNGNQL